MQLHVFTSIGAVRRANNVESVVRGVVEALAATTDTSELVVAVYLLRHKDYWRGEASTRQVTRRMFARGGRHWRFVGRFAMPVGLPRRFHLIRMAFGMRAEYPLIVRDVYDWELRCERFEDLVAYTCAHELHHFRKYALGLHPREGEQAACRYGLALAEAAGYGVRGRRVKSAKKAVVDPHVEHLRALPNGAEVVIVQDTGRRQYVGQAAIKLRTPRTGSQRMAIRTSDGREWYWPMAWLAPGDTSEPGMKRFNPIQGILPF